MRSKIFLSVVLLCVYWTFFGLFSHTLKCDDETRVAGISQAASTVETKIIPNLNGKPFLEYPPLYYIVQNAVFSVVDDSDIATAIPSVFCSLASLFLLYALALCLGFHPFFALLATFLCMSCVSFIANRNICRVDMMLSMFVLLSVYGGVLALKSKGKTNLIFGFVLCCIGIAGGVLTKGFVGAVFPLSILGSTAFFSDIYNKRISRNRYLFLFLAFLIGVIPLACWYILVYRHGGSNAFYEAFVVNNFGRFSGQQGDHTGSAFYYFKRLPEFCAPYFIFAIFAMVMLIRQFFKSVRGSVSERDIFLLCAFLVPFLMLNLSAAKRLVYLLPLVPFASLLAIVGVKMLIRCLPRRLSYGFYRFCYCHICIIVLALCFIGLIVQCALFFAAQYSYFEKSADPVFMKCANLEEHGRKIVLVDAHERTRGAAVFYLKHNVDEKKHTEADPSDFREVWVVRAPPENVGVHFPAKLFLLMTKQHKQEYLKIMANKENIVNSKK